MNLLQLCNKSPFPPRDGGAIATLGLSQAFLDAGHSVTILCMSTPRHPYRSAEIPTAMRGRIDVFSVTVDSRPKIVPALINLCSALPYHAQRFRSKIFSRELGKMLRKKNFDIVQLEGLYLAQYLPPIRRHSQAKAVMRAHNVEHEIWERTASNSSGLKKRYLMVQSNRILNFERGMLNLYDLLVPVSERDAAHFRAMGCRIPIQVSPIGIDSREIALPDRSPGTGSLFFLGSLDWLPNLEGLEWFLQKVWPVLRARHHGLQFYIAGRNPAAWVRKLNDDRIQVDGEVEDARAYMARHDIMIAPLFAGSGMRVKILEAMALGRAVITTTLGAEGIEGRDGVHLLVADTPEDFAEHVKRCISDAAFSSEIGRNARELVRARYDLQKLAGQLLNRYLQLL